MIACNIISKYHSLKLHGYPAKTCVFTCRRCQKKKKKKKSKSWYSIIIPV